MLALGTLPSVYAQTTLQLRGPSGPVVVVEDAEPISIAVDGTS